MEQGEGKSKKGIHFGTKMPRKRTKNHKMVSLVGLKAKVERLREVVKDRSDRKIIVWRAEAEIVAGN